MGLESGSSLENNNLDCRCFVRVPGILRYFEITKNEWLVSTDEGLARVMMVTGREY